MATFTFLNSTQFKSSPILADFKCLQIRRISTSFRRRFAFSISLKLKLLLRESLLNLTQFNFVASLGAGQWDGVSRVRRLMIDRGIKKSIACSWIKVKNEVHAFLSGDTSHPTCDAIYAELERLTGLITDAGYAPTTRKIFHDVEDGEKTGMVCSHSERLAIAFGLINSQPGTTLLIRLRSS
ncbi:pentatricopeptide repeat-containing protein At1g25360-like isoform X2 [Spinacia oleracea]|uniref:Pentatricopeptide repeat-containing protein At1g25360-like isoform X2 n=1 Tax=Spinacia oleracea TaxID=3562 RepID=A0ABM3RNH6_SPIOL|nr:pentatricopeptide repeat-containing protein At1g25360-like isoform X2 [Spinacia oleracea]